MKVCVFQISLNSNCFQTYLRNIFLTKTESSKYNTALDIGGHDCYIIHMIKLLCKKMAIIFIDNTYLPPNKFGLLKEALRMED